jgi:hypothetical protein
MYYCVSLYELKKGYADYSNLSDADTYLSDYRASYARTQLFSCKQNFLEIFRHIKRMKLFENRALRRIFGPKTDDATGEWRRLHNEELNDLYSSPNIRVIKSIRMRWEGHVARMGEKRGAYRILVGRPEGRRPLGRPRRR